jgi:ATP-dependent helicase HrpB
MLSPHSAVETSELFVSLAPTEPGAATATSAKQDAQIGIASSVEREWIEAVFPGSIGKHCDLAYDAESDSVLSFTGLAFGDLLLQEPTPSRPNPDDAHTLLVNACAERWETRFLSRSGLAQLIDRLKFLSQTLPTQVSDAGGFDIENTKHAALEELCFGETRLSDVLAKPVEDTFYRHLPKGIQDLLKEAPATLTVPSGSLIRLNYPESRPPYLEVRIQEIFGWTTSPRIAFGGTPVTLHLLGPNFRPVQVTSDLESFWKNGYVDVRKELRARYPKHSWPEDPLTAQPEAKGRRRSD